MEADLGSALWRHDRALLPPGARLVGVDEAGRGALAGPVVAAACVAGDDLLADPARAERCRGINDSKQLTAAARESQYALVCGLRDAGLLDFATAEASVGEIEQLNILGATRLAMRRALESVASRATGWTLPGDAADGPLFQAAATVLVLVDGRPLRPFPYAHTGLVKGDGKSLCIAAASIAAKVERDRAMAELDRRHPGYGFAAHKGYGTAAHRAALLDRGPAPVHRRSFLGRILGG